MVAAPFHAAASLAVNGHPNSRLDELLPWTYPATAEIKDGA
jgi:hypothetical protein